MPDLCLLHPVGEEHEITGRLVGVETSDHGVVLADRDCAENRGVDEKWLRDPAEVRS